MSANIDLVTSHKGSAHISTQNVIDLIAGLSGEISGVKIFKDLYNGLDHEIMDTLSVKIKTGAALANGFFFILDEAYDWILDPGVVGYSRIDVLYLTIYEDSDTNVQTADFVYEVGNDYQNGTTGTVPGPPTGTTILAAFPLVRVDMSDGAIVSVTDYAQPYLSNSSLVETVNELVEQLEQDVGGTVEQVNTNTNDIAQMKVTFQDGVDTIYDAIDDYVTPAASTPSALAAAVDDVYAKGKTDAESVTWTQSIKVDGHTFDSPLSVMATYDAKNLISLKCTSLTQSNIDSIKIYWILSNGSQSTQTVSQGGTYNCPSNAIRFIVSITKSTPPSTTASVGGTVEFIATYQAKILR